MLNRHAVERDLLGANDSQEDIFCKEFERHCWRLEIIGPGTKMER